MIRLRNRRRLRRKEVADLASTLEATFGGTSFGNEKPIDVADTGKFEVFLVDGKAFGLMFEGRPTLTVRGVLKYGATKRYVTVDMGAVGYVYNGADIMAPGIVEADPVIGIRDFVWVRDERNRQPLAVGEALMPGSEMTAAKKGKAVKSLHHVGDDVWKLGSPE